ncbi:replication initiator protein [Blackfly microvirus SF02]|uniref:Replication initiator protein n=1 Tax=Blackfly microvirus SF02 TaxID=2576452 RepID=A0A4P8PP52_9VIRU|nr:replication initiator protein [Blackfly microvirus SF02]
MACYSPLTGFRSKVINPETGKRRIVFRRDQAYDPYDPIDVGCGQCIGCRLVKAYDWAARAMHEKRLCASADFVTLTYDEKSLPESRSLEKSEFQLFMKRLRHHYGTGIRFMACGEYGSLTLRPHYHIILFNAGLERRFYKMAPGGQRLYFCAPLDLVWGKGLCVVGDVDYDSCSYVASYVCDKVTGEQAASHYKRVSPDGRSYDVEPEFLLTSRRPGLGRGYVDKFGSELLAHGNIIYKGRQAPIPRSYFNYLESIDLHRVAVLKRELREKIVRSEQTTRRRVVREKVALGRKSLKRKDVT